MAPFGTVFAQFTTKQLILKQNMYPSDLVVYSNFALNIKKTIEGASRIFLFLFTVWITKFTEKT